jgi:hypothetical protein
VLGRDKRTYLLCWDGYGAVHLYVWIGGFWIVLKVSIYEELGERFWYDEMDEAFCWIKMRTAL